MFAIRTVPPRKLWPTKWPLLLSVGPSSARTSRITAGWSARRNADFSLEGGLVEIDPVEDLKAVHPQRGGHVERIVACVGELARVLVRRVTDH